MGAREEELVAVGAMVGVDGFALTRRVVLFRLRLLLLLLLVGLLLVHFPMRSAQFLN